MSPSPGWSRRLGASASQEASESVRLAACQSCHTQYDVTDVMEKEISCRCGEKVEIRSLVGMDVGIHRCGSCGAHVASDAQGCDYCGSEIVRDTRKLSLICPECCGRNVENSRFCTGCGVAFSPEHVQVEGVELPCPVCGCLMPTRAVGGVGINECPQCNGIWVPEDRLEALISRAIEAKQSADPELFKDFQPRVKGANPATQKVAYRKCPVCEAFMQRRNFRKSSGVIVDRCREHGTWLDADELEQITGFILTGGRPRAEEYLKQSKTDAEEARAGAAFTKIMAEQRAGPFSRPEPRERGVVSSFLGLLDNLLG
jgi:Zn-finger nucleic acid-binding protein